MANKAEKVKSEGVDEVTFLQVLFKGFNQYSLNKGLRIFEDKGVQAINKELSQMHLHDSFASKRKNDLTPHQMKNKCEAVTFLKEKKMEK